MAEIDLTTEAAKQLKLAVEILIALNSTMTDAQRKTIPLMLRRWKSGENYSNGEYVCYIDAAGSIDVYVASRNITAATMPPDVVTTPANWKKI